MNALNQKNKNILNRDKIRIDIKIHELINISNEGLRSLILNCDNDIKNYKRKYFINGMTKRKKFDNFIITPEIKEVFSKLDSLNIPITQFIKWLVQKDITTNRPQKPKEEKKKREYDFTNQEEQYITIEDLKSEIAMSNCYSAFITQIKITNSYREVIEELAQNLTLIQNHLLKDKDKIILFGNYIISKEKLKIKSNNFSSFNINEILMMYRKILVLKEIPDTLRFQIVKNFRELMYCKAFIIYSENKNNKYFGNIILNDLLYVSKINDYYSFLDEDVNIYKTLFPNNCDDIENNIEMINHCMNIEKVKHDNIYILDKFNFVNIAGEQIDKQGNEIFDITVPFPKSPELKRTKFQSGYVSPRSKKINHFTPDNKKISVPEIKDLIKKGDYNKVKNLYYRVQDNRTLNAYCDSETEYILFDGVQEIDKKSFKKIYNSMIDSIKRKSPEEIQRLNDIKYFNGDKSPIQSLLSNELTLKTELVTIQCNFQNEKKEDNVVIFVREDKKKYYGKNELNHTYEKKLNYYFHTESKKKISKIDYLRLSFEDKKMYSNIEMKEVIAKIIYTKDVTKSYMDYMLSWYYQNIDCQSNKQPLLTVWFHNLKFDMLSTGLLDKFQDYDLTLNHFNNQIPRFFDFEINEEILLKSTSKKPKLFFIDSFNFSATSLEKMGKTVGIKKPKELVDFNLNTNLIVDKDCLIYSTMDVVILPAFINEFKKYILEYATLKYGAAGTAQNVFLSHFYSFEEFINNKGEAFSSYEISKKIIEEFSGKDLSFLDEFKTESLRNFTLKNIHNSLDQNIKDKINIREKEEFKKLKRVNAKIHLHKNKYLEALEMGSYYGGRTEVFNYTGLIKYIMSIDINSSYPGSMLNSLPTEYLHSIIKPSKHQLNNILKDKNQYGLFKVFVKSDKNRIIPLIHDKKIVNPHVKNLSVILHMPEFKLLYEKNKNIEVEEVHIYKATDKLFKSFINKWSFEKSYNKQKFIANEVMVSISKLLMNSTYGKFGEKMRVSKCFKLNEDELKFWSKLISLTKNELITLEMLSKCIYNYDLKHNMELNHDIDLSIKKYFGAIHTPMIELYNELFDNDIIRDIMKHISDDNLRINFFGGYLSYSKKIEVPAKNSTLILVGAITSYSRSALYKGIDKLGITNVFYGDTDSLYYDSKIDDVFYNIPLSEKESILDNKEAYQNIIDNVNKNVDKNKSKIPLVKSLISSKHLWEKEYQKPYDIIVRGNKDNVKIFYIPISETFIIGKHGTKEDFIKSDLKYCIHKGNIEKFKKSIKTIKKEKFYYVRLSEKHKGVSLKAQLVNQDLYLIEDWLSIATQRQKFGSLDGQYITYKLKSLYNSRNDYQKSKAISKRKKSVSFIVANNFNDNFGNQIDNKQILDYELKYKYVEQKLQPLELTLDKSFGNMQLIETSKVKEVI